MRRFWAILRLHRKYVWAMGFFMSLGIPLALISPQLIKQVIDEAQAGVGVEALRLRIVLLIGMAIASVLLGIGTGYASSLFRLKVLRDVRLRLFLHLQGLSLRYHQARETGNLMSRQVDDVDNLGGVMADAFVSAGIGGVRAVAFLVMIILLEWRMALGGLLFVLIIFGIQYFVSRPLRERSRIARERQSELNEALHQSITGHDLVHATASEKREAKRFARVLHRSVRARLSQELYGLFTGHVMGLVGGVAPVLIILVGVWLIARGEFTVGGLFAFFMYLGQMFGAVGEIARLNPAFQSSLASLQRIYEVLDETPEIASPRHGHRPPVARGAVTFEGVDFAYEPDTPVLREVGFRAEPGEVVALVGPSGGGKSTLVRLIPRFYDPTRGRVTVDGHDLRELDLRWLRQRVGIVPQEIFLFDRSIAENIAYGAPRAGEEEIREAAQAANALEFIEAMPQGFDSVIGERGVRLSGGQRQRLAIAREILRDPRILILDEATSSLDSESERLIQEALDRLLVGRTAFIVAHRLSTVMRADRILVLDAGRIVESGSHAELLGLGGLYARLHATQFREVPRPEEAT